MRSANTSNRWVAAMLRSGFGVAVVLMLFSNAVRSQTMTKAGTDQMTPANLAAGSPAGSYALSGFDSVSLFNGNLNFRLPLLAIGGRGSAGYTMMLSLNTKSWHVKRTSFLVNGEETNVTYTPTPNTWQKPNLIGYGPGILLGRRSGAGTFSPPPHSGSCAIFAQTLTRFTFTGPDGTEFEFVDQATLGKPYTTTLAECQNPAAGFSRGRVFITTKGEAATFISDTAITDANPVTAQASIVPTNGWMFLRDGTRYRIDNQLVSWIQDRNGNKITFNSYDGNQRLLQVTDSLNRRVNISYDNSSPTDCTVHYDVITFTGFAGAVRTIQVGHDCLVNALRSDQTLMTYTQLFPPELTGSGNISPQTFNDKVVTGVTLPDGRQYKFLYNSYAEVARVVLPTGGAFEYDYTPKGSEVGDDNVTGVDLEIYRRVIERRVMPDGTNVEGLTRYTPVTGVGGTVTVDHWDGSVTLLLAHEEHTFHTSGAPLQDGLQPSVMLYPDVLDGMEDHVDAMDTNGAIVTSPLRREDNSYTEDQAPWTDNTFGVFQWYVNPRLTDTFSNLLDVSPPLVSKRRFTYDQYNNPTSVKEYDFGSNQPGALVRQTQTSYLASGYDTVTGGTGNPDPLATIHIRNFPTQQQVFDGNAVLRAQTAYEYDNYNQTTSDSFHASLTNRSNITGLDGSSTTSYYTRGNMTKTTHAVSFDSSGNVASSISGYAQYDIAGNAVEVIDPRSTSSNIIATTFDFSDAYGYANSNARGNETPLPVALPSTTHTYAFATIVTNALQQNAYIQYDYYLGKPVNSEDSNGVVTQGTYGDLLDRPTGVDTGIFAGAQFQRHTAFVYDDSSHLITTQSDQTTLNVGVLTSAVVYDGLGRTTETRVSAPEGTIHTTHQYDAMGRVKRTYNPYLTTNGGYSDAAYDALGRVTTVTTADGAVVTTTYSGNTVNVTDQAGKTRRSITDGLGRLTRVDEPDSTGLGTVAAPTQPTSYVYDVLDDLVKVTQGSQSRYFAYDSLKRLVRARNPEQDINASLIPALTDPVTLNSQWCFKYEYDEASNLLTKTDARSITTNYGYDKLNRIINKSYLGDPQNTPAVAYIYDAQNLPALLPAGAPGFDRGSSTGRLVAVIYGPNNTGTYQGYDKIGRVVQSIQVTDTQSSGSPTPQAYGFNYTYNLASEMLTETYPSGRIVPTEYDTAGRVAGVKKDATSYYAGAAATDPTNRIQYAPHGAISAMKLGNGKWEHMTFNNRLQPSEIGLGASSGASDLLKLEYTYNSSDPNIHDDNGNVRTQKITAPKTGSGNLVLTQTYTYDPLNRLQTAREDGSPSWTQTYDCDRYGNRAVRNTSYIPTPSVGLTPLSANSTDFSAFNQASNRLNNGIPAQVNIDYDSSGNLKKDAAARTMTYDAENRLLSFNGGTGQYFYDSDGHRVKKVDSTGTTVFVYNAGGQLIAEYTSGPPPGGGTSYLTSDDLGSTRVVTSAADVNGNVTVKARYDYLPFGEEIGSDQGSRSLVTGYLTTDKTRQKFTQKERDNESGLDYFGARYYSSPQGRFTSSDPLLSSGTVYDPQTWNRYSYTLNNPLKYIDPFGLYVYGTGATDELKKKFEKGLKDLERARNSFKKRSDEYKRIDRALTAYGKVGVDNGVTVNFGATKDGTLAATAPGIASDASGMKVTSNDNPTGQRTTLTIDPTQNTSGFEWASSIGHEGSHIADVAAAVASLPTNLTDPRAQAALTGAFSLNLVKWTTEWKAYTTESNIAQALASDSAVSVGGNPKFEIWNGGWAEADRASKRAAGIFKVLVQPQSQKGTYHLNPFAGDFGKRLLD
jgi:RHS repeat-associated protein